MWTRLLFKLNNTVAGGALMISFFSFLSKILALVRERLIAHNFGASELSDIYYSAFRLPDLIFNTLVLGALTSAFIPVFQKIWRQDRREGLILASSVMNFFVLLVGILVIISLVFTPQLMALITPGFQEWQLAEVVKLSRVMLIAVMFFVVSNVVGGVLNSWKKFFSFSMAASFYNLGIIIGIVFFYPAIGLIGLAWGVFLGAALHLIVQLPELVRSGWKYQFVLKFNGSLQKIIKLMIPRTLGLAAAQINLLVITMIASTMTAGSIAIFNLANNLQSLPISLFAISLAIAVFPTFTQAVSDNNQKLFNTNFSLSLRRILFLLIPISIFIVILRAQIVRVILGTGAFSWENTYYTAQTLGFFALSIFAQGLIPLLARAFYAFEDTKTPMLISVFSIIVNIILSWFMAKLFGVVGLALAFSMASIINMLLLYLFLSQRVDYLDQNHIFNSLMRISANAIVAGFVTYTSLYFLANLVNMQTFWGVFTQGFGAGLLGLLTYLILSILFKLEEVDIVKRLLLKSLRILRNGKNT